MVLQLHRNIEDSTPRRIYCAASEWFSYEDNVHQRDTERHAAAVLKDGYLASYLPQHGLVDAAQLPNGRLFKLNGHTRGYLWNQKKIPVPDQVEVTIWQCRDYEEMRRMYKSFDSSKAAKSAGDDLFGAMREDAIEFKSKYLANKRFSSALKSVHEHCFGASNASTADATELVRFWLPELRLFDECNPGKNRFVTGITAAALITLRRYGPDAQDFWRAYASDSGNKVDGLRDAVQAYDDRLRSIESESGMGSRKAQAKTLQVTISAVDAHRNDRWYQPGSGIKASKISTVRQFIRSALRKPRAW